MISHLVTALRCLNALTSASCRRRGRTLMSWTKSTRLRRGVIALVAVGGLIGGGLAQAMTPAAAADTTDYTATQTIPVPPASTYAGSGGGDGWGLAMTP